MYINPFVLGVLTTLFAETALVIALVIIAGVINNKKK